MRRVIGALVLLAVVALASGLGVAAEVKELPPMVMDKETGHFKDMSADALSDTGLSWEQRTRIFGGDTATYGPLTAEQRKAKQKELKEVLAKIDTRLVEKCEADMREWLDIQIARPLKKPGWEKNWKLNWSVYTKVSMFPLSSQAVTFFRAYEMWGDKKYLDAGLKRANIFLNAQLRQGPYRAKYGHFTVSNKYQDLPWSIVMYAYKLTKDKKYLDSAKKCADILLSIQRPDSGGWPDQWPLSGGRGRPGKVVRGTSHNDSATVSPFVMMVMMYHATGDAKYVADLHKLGPHMVKTNLGVDGVTGWAEAYHDGGAPQRVRQYEIELCYPSSLSRSTGFLLTWLYLMDGNEKHMELLKGAWNSIEKIRQRDVEPKNWKHWKALKDAGGVGKWYCPGMPHAFLPDLSNTGGVLAYRMHPIYPLTQEQQKKWGRFLHGQGGDLAHWAATPERAKAAPNKFLGWGTGNNLSQVRRALLEYRRSGYEGLLRYYTGPTKYTPDQYLQARVDAAKRALDPRHVRLAKHPRGIKSLEEGGYLLNQKHRWYGKKMSKWGRAYEDRINDRGGHAGFYQWQLVYDAMIAQGRIDADTAARGGRGMEAWMSCMSHLDSWDVIGSYDNHVVEVENHFDVPIKGRKR